MKIIDVKIVLFLCCLVIVTACGESGGLSYRSLDDCKQVAELKQIGNNKVTVCDINLLKDTIVLPLSYFTEELHIVKLDNKVEAFVSETGVTIGEKYILVTMGGISKVPYKLFDKSGKFITNIGNFGKGPNEYNYACNIPQLDEINNCIYLLPLLSSQIFVYDMIGNYLDPIGLSYRCTRARMHVDLADSSVTIITVPLEKGRYSAPCFAWSQTVSGEMIHCLSPDFLSIENHHVLGGWSDVYSNRNVKELDFFINNSYKPRNDTLYHYDIKNNQIIPKFSVDFGKRQIPIHSYFELPYHYMGDICEKKEAEDLPGGYIALCSKNFIVDKTNLKGSYFKLVNDFLGNIEIDWPCRRFTNGYYSVNYEPVNLLELLENSLTNNTMIPEMREKLTDLKNSIKETDNNYILYAKLKH